ncbi:MAG: DNA-processing protein DprA [Anaerolineales bacterium]|nr:DNA-processing protein DprA [Anaerolineales bacterium]
MDDTKKYWVGFNLVKGIGPARLRALLDHFGAVEHAWRASPVELEAAGLNSRLVESLQQTRSSDLLENTWKRIHAKGISVLTWDDHEYPRRLKEIDQPPPVLYVRGGLLEEDQWAVALVGTRRITNYGRQVTQELAGALARNGVTVVSGLARGVDGIAHQACLDNGGRTLAVLGCGVDIIYPPEHQRLAERVLANGALISDYPPGTPPEAINFPPRNRIISGLSQAVVVVEAGKKSGALITAAFAAEQGREVFAVPGNIYAPQSKGANLLIQEGAQILLNVDNVLESLNLGQVEQHRAARVALPADAVEARLYQLLGREPLHVDDIRNLTDLPIEKVSATLTLMELKGMVRQVGNMHYVAVYEARADYRFDPPSEQ